MTEKEPLRSGDWYINGICYPGVNLPSALQLAKEHEQQMNNKIMQTKTGEIVVVEAK